MVLIFMLRSLRFSGWQQTNTGFGQRSSSATGYLNPVLARSNLDVLISTQVTRLMPLGNSSQKGLPDLRKIEIAQTSDGFSVFFQFFLLMLTSNTRFPISHPSF